MNGELDGDEGHQIICLDVIPCPLLREIAAKWHLTISIQPVHEIWSPKAEGAKPNMRGVGHLYGPIVFMQRPATRPCKPQDLA